MRTPIAMFLASALLVQGVLGAGETCETKSQWGDNACSVGGGLQVKSVPKNLEVTSQNCDHFYPKSEFQKQPIISLSDAKSGETYTLVMVDPDAPNHPKGTYYLHWIIANIPGDDLKKGELKNGKNIAAYRGPAPPDGSGTHRYMLLVFRHPPSSAPVTQELSDTQRKTFNLGEWLSKNKLCGPISGAQFRTNFSGNPKS